MNISRTPSPACRRWGVRGLLVAALLAVAARSHACPVCFGDIDSPIIDGLQSSILFMVGVTYFEILSGVAAFILLRRRARRLASQTTETA